MRQCAPPTFSGNTHRWATKDWVKITGRVLHPESPLPLSHFPTARITVPSVTFSKLKIDINKLTLKFYKESQRN